MMTKLSVAMVAPAIAVLFAVKFFQSRAFKRLIGQFAAFAAVCFPLGLWWGVRNLIRTDTPLTYVPDIGKSNIQYLGDYSVWRRLFDVRTPDVWIARGKSYGYDYFDYNIPLTMLKTSVFGEYYIGKNEPLLSVFAYVLSLSNLLLAVAAFVLLLRYVFAKNGFLCGGLRAFFGVLVASMLGMYIKFCFDYPYNCTQDFRYVVPLAVVGGQPPAHHVIHRSPVIEIAYLTVHPLHAGGALVRRVAPRCRRQLGRLPRRRRRFAGGGGSVLRLLVRAVCVVSAVIVKMNEKGFTNLDIYGILIKVEFFAVPSGTWK